MYDTTRTEPLCHAYADHLAVDGSTSYFAHVYAMTERVANEHFNFNYPTGSASYKPKTLNQCCFNAGPVSQLNGSPNTLSGNVMMTM